MSQSPVGAPAPSQSPVGAPALSQSPVGAPALSQSPVLALAPFHSLGQAPVLAQPTVRDLSPEKTQLPVSPHFLWGSSSL